MIQIDEVAVVVAVHVVNKSSQISNLFQLYFSFLGGSRSFRGGFNSNFRDRDTSDIELTSNASAGPAFSNWPNARPSAQFEPGEAFRESTSPKDSFKFVVSYIETANDFFIQLLSKGDELSSLNETLQTEYKKSPETNLSSFKQGQACLAKSSTYGCWYRGKGTFSFCLMGVNINFFFFF